MILFALRVRLRVLLRDILYSGQFCARLKLFRNLRAMSIAGEYRSGNCFNLTHLALIGAILSS